MKHKRNVKMADNLLSLTKNRWFFLTLVWAYVIYYLSTAQYSSVSSAKFLAAFFEGLRITISSQVCALLNALLRKSAHLTEYAVLAVLLYKTFKPAKHPRWSRRAAFWALVISAGYSLTDEFHQRFVPGRHASIFDCMIDTAGASLGLCILSVAMSELGRTRDAFLRTKSLTWISVLIDSRRASRFPLSDDKELKSEGRS